MSRKLSRPFANWGHGSSVSFLLRLPCGKRVSGQGQAKAWRQRTLDAGDGSNMLAKAGEHGLLRSPAWQAWTHIYRANICCNSRSVSFGLKPVIARVRLQCLTNLLSAGAWPASSCMRVTLEFLQEHAPSKKTVASATRYGHGHVHFKRRPHIGFAPCMMAWLRCLKRVSAGRPRVSQQIGRDRKSTRL